MPFIGPYWKNFATLFGVFCFLFQELEVFWSGTNYEIKSDAQHDIDRIMALWQKCRSEFGTEGDWLFGDFSIADAMYAPVVLRFAGYDVPLNKLESAYVQTVLKHPAIIEWIEVGKQEQEVIAMDEIEV